MKKHFLLCFLCFSTYFFLKGQSWVQVPGYDISYGDISGITRYQGNIWVKTGTGIYKITSSGWVLTSAGFSVNTDTKGCLYTDGVDLYAGGLFDSTTSKALVIKWENNQWNPVGFTDNTAGGVWVESILKRPAGLHVGGFFNTIGSTPSSLVHSPYYSFFNGIDWIQLFPIVTTGCAARIESIQYLNDSIYVAGGFNQVGSIWTPATFRFKEVGTSIFSLSGYGSCSIAGNYQWYKGVLYASGTRPSDNLGFNLGLSTWNGSTWFSNLNQIQITETKIASLSGRLFVAGAATGAPIAGFTPVIISYDGVSVVNEGLGLSSPSNPLFFVPAISKIFADTVENKLYVGGNFLKTNGNVADNFAVRSVYPLPVTLSKFSGIYRQNQILLEWRDETPEEGVEFDVQMSNDGRTFTSFGKVKEKDQQYEYVFSFKNPPCGTLYFRLFFEEKYSGVIPIIIPCTKRVSLSQLGNILHIDTKISGAVILYDLTGKKRIRFSVQKGVSKILLLVEPGQYIARFIAQDGTVVTKRIVL